MQLTWCYEAAATAGPIFAPPSEELEELHRLARAGNMSELRVCAAHIAVLDPRYGVIADKLHRMAEGYQSKAILAFVKEHIGRG